MIMTRRGVLSFAQSSAMECAPSTVVPLASLARKSSTFDVVLLKTATLNPWSVMLSTRFWPITARPINPISQVASGILLSAPKTLWYRSRWTPRSSPDHDAHGLKGALFVDQVNRGFGDRAVNLHGGRVKAGRAEVHLRVVRKSEAFFWPANHVAVQLVIRVLIMQHCDRISSRRKLEFHCCLIPGERMPRVRECFGIVFGPAVR